ncbi:MAG: SAM-dependent methyltransferase [Streptosporangiaceae bacterium]
MSDQPGSKPASPPIDTTVPHSARVWNYWLGGEDNFPVDRRAGDRYQRDYPAIVDTARAARHFMARVVRYLAGEAGIRQFLDVGTGLPTADNTHEVAQAVAPSSRVVYVDNDPLVLTHARALLASSPEGACDYIEADMRDPAVILHGAARTLDLSVPAALLFIGVLGHLADYEQARSVVGGILAGLPPGSYLVLADSIDTGQAHRDAGQRYAKTGAVPYRLRSPEEITSLFTGLDLIEPGVVHVQSWRPDPAPSAPVHVDAIGGVARKPAR